MINTLIVDDEYLLRKGLIALIDWQTLGFQVVGEASDGSEAADFIENNPVDLVISDIRMPILSGIDLMRSVRERKKMLNSLFSADMMTLAMPRARLNTGLFPMFSSLLKKRKW